jgi:hypothetical protein
LRILRGLCRTAGPDAIRIDVTPGDAQRRSIYCETK